MNEFTLAEKEQSDLNEALDDHATPEKIRRKLLCLRMRAAGVPLDQIATSMRRDVRTISNYIAEFRSGGLAAVMEDRAYRPSSDVEPYWDQLKEHFQRNPVATVKQGARQIQRLTGIQFSTSQARRVMTALGLGYRKVGQVPGKGDVDKQLEFLDQQLKPRLEEAARGTRKVFFVDASHFVMGAFMGMLWCFRRLFVRGASGRRRYNVLGALDSHTREVITVSNDTYITAPTVCQLMTKLRRKHSDIPITLVLDNARYQKCRLVLEAAEEQGFELLYLPPYSPNLNLIERLWKFVKKECLANEYYDDFEDFKTAINTTLRKVNGSLRKETESLFTLNFQIVPQTDIIGKL